MNKRLHFITKLRHIFSGSSCLPQTIGVFHSIRQTIRDIIVIIFFNLKTGEKTNGICITEGFSVVYAIVSHELLFLLDNDENGNFSAHKCILSYLNKAFAACMYIFYIIDGREGVFFRVELIFPPPLFSKLHFDPSTTFSRS